MPKPLIWIVGDANHPDFAPAWHWLRQYADVEQRTAPAAGARAPQAVLFLPTRSGQITQELVETFHRAVPLARLVALAGVFCEGEVRSGRISQGVARVYWHQWAERLPRELGLAGANHWRPRSQSESDELLLTLGPAIRRRPQSELVAICTADRGGYEALADACWVTGRRSVWQEPAQAPHFHSADALLAEGWRTLHTLARFQGSAFAPCPPTILLADFPRPEDSAESACQGSIRPHRILARPLLIADLFAALDAVAARQSEARRDTTAA